MIKPNGKFNPDYFAEAELEEMNNLIDIFAQRWVVVSEMSDASHQAIKSWLKTYSRSPDAVIDPIEEFDRNITEIPEENLQTAELKYLMRRRISEIAVC